MVLEKENVSILVSKPIKEGGGIIEKYFKAHSISIYIIILLGPLSCLTGNFFF